VCGGENLPIEFCFLCDDEDFFLEPLSLFGARSLRSSVHMIFWKFCQLNPAAFQAIR